MSEILKVGLIGYGLAGRAFHAPLISTTPGLRLSAIVTSAPERIAAVAQEQRLAQSGADRHHRARAIGIRDTGLQRQYLRLAQFGECVRRRLQVVHQARLRNGQARAEPGLVQ